MLHPRTWLSLLVVSCGIVMVSAAAFTLSVDNSSFRSLKASSETMENFSVRLVVSTGRHNRTHHPSSRHDVVVGPIPGRDIPRSSILSFVVCHSHHLQHYADPSFSWYKRSEFGIRAALFFSAASISGAFGALLAVRKICAFSKIPVDIVLPKAAISKMNGALGKEGWAWIFILEGAVTILAGFMSFWIIQDFPDGAKFLTEAERTVIVRRLQDDCQHSAAGEKLGMKHIRQSLSDWKTYLASKSHSPHFKRYY